MTARWPAAVIRTTKSNRTTIRRGTGARPGEWQRIEEGAHLIYRSANGAVIGYCPLANCSAASTHNELR